MAGDELVRRLAVAVLALALGEDVLFMRFQHRDPPDFLQIAGDAEFGRHAPISACQDFASDSFETKLSTVSPIVNLISKHYYLLIGAHVRTRNGRAPAAGRAACAS